MSECLLMKDCAFFNNRIGEVPNGGAFLKSLFCLKKSEHCERKKKQNLVSVSDSTNRTTPLGMEAKAV